MGSFNGYAARHITTVLFGCLMPNRCCSIRSNWTIMCRRRAHVRPEANPPTHSQVVPRAADKSRTRDLLFLAHPLNPVTVLFPQLPYLFAWSQYCRLSLLSMPCASPLKNVPQPARDRFGCTSSGPRIFQRPSKHVSERLGRPAAKALVLPRARGRHEDDMLDARPHGRVDGSDVLRRALSGFQGRDDEQTIETRIGLRKAFGRVEVPESSRSRSRDGFGRARDSH